jgi:exodeoxyribonuclease VII small subunit
VKKPAETPASFEAALLALETIVGQMESGQMPLEESLTAYKRGVELLRYCQNTLKDTEQQIRILDEQGQLKDFGNE